MSAPSQAPRFVALVGPTASGKTALSLEVARRLPTEVISMDSRQIYRGMDVGTGKITPLERGGVPHHGLDLRDPDESYSAGEFSRQARGWLDGIRARGRVPLLVGGTGFFLRALMEPMFAEPELDPGRLVRLRNHLNGMDREDLLRLVEVLDPKRVEVGREGGRQRLTRTIEVALLTGRPLSWWHREKPPVEAPLSGLVFVLDHPRELLYERINARVERMVREEGLLEEVRGLLARGYGRGDPGMTGAGYREALAHLRGEISLEEMVSEIQQSHRKYARRQMTWFRHQLPEGARFLNGTIPLSKLAEGIQNAWEHARNPEGTLPPEEGAETMGGRGPQG